jgi:predicted NBD/HSP70 family sugar kinase
MYKGNLGLLRDHNRALVINILRETGPMSRTQLSLLTGLAPSTLTRLIKDLLQEGVVQEIGKSQSNGGRCPVLVAFNPSYAFAIGIKVERQMILAAKVDLAGKIQDKVSVSLSTPPHPCDVMDQVEKVARSLGTERTLGIGLAISGFVDAKRGIDLYSPILGWRDVPLSEPLSKRLDLPVWVENDVNALTLAERWYGAGRQFKNFLCITVGEGIGAGIVIDGELYRGAFGGAGEVGHITVDPDGPRCRCGERGCLEVFASDLFLHAEAERLGFSSIEELAQAARNGDKEAAETFRRMGRALGIGVKNVVNLLNPEAIVLGGERMFDSDLFMSTFEEEVRHHAFPKEAEELRIVSAELGPDGFLVGAATLAIREFFRLPLLEVAQ